MFIFKFKFGIHSSTICSAIHGRPSKGECNDTYVLTIFDRPDLIQSKFILVAMLLPSPPYVIWVLCFFLFFSLRRQYSNYYLSSFQSPARVQYELRPFVQWESTAASRQLQHLPRVVALFHEEVMFSRNRKICIELVFLIRGRRLSFTRKTKSCSTPTTIRQRC